MGEVDGVSDCFAELDTRGDVVDVRESWGERDRDGLAVEDALRTGECDGVDAALDGTGDDVSRGDADTVSLALEESDVRGDADDDRESSGERD